MKSSEVTVRGSLVTLLLCASPTAAPRFLALGVGGRGGSP